MWRVVDASGGAMADGVGPGVDKFASGGAGVAPGAPSAADLSRWERNYQGERAGAATLRSLARTAPNPLRAAALEGLAAAEDGQAEYWAGKLRAAGAAVPPFRPSLRDRLILVLAPRLGPRAILPLVAADALRGVEAYRAQPDAAPLVASETAVARAAVALVAGGRATEAAERGREHRRSNAGNGSLRAAVF